MGRYRRPPTREGAGTLRVEVCTIATTTTVCWRPLARPTYSRSSYNRVTVWHGPVLTVLTISLAKHQSAYPCGQPPVGWFSGRVGLVYRRDVTGCLCCLTPGGNAGRNIPSPESWSRRCGVYSCSMRPRIRPLVGGATILAWGEFGIREFGSPDTRIIRVFTSRMGVNEMNTCHVFIYCGEYAYNSRIHVAPLTNLPCRVRCRVEPSYFTVRVVEKRHAAQPNGSAPETPIPRVALQTATKSLTFIFSRGVAGRFFGVLISSSSGARGGGASTLLEIVSESDGSAPLLPLIPF